MQVHIKLVGSWELVPIALDRRTIRAAMSSVVREELKYMRDKVVAAFDTAGQSNGRPWQSTKTGRKPFQDSKIKTFVKVAQPPNALTGYVYIPRSAKFKSAKAGTDTQRALWAHENGAVISIPVSAKMLRALAAKRRSSRARTSSTGQKLSVGGVMIVRLPRRSFLADTLAAHGGRGFQERVVKSLARKLPMGWRPT